MASRTDSLRSCAPFIFPPEDAPRDQMRSPKPLRCFAVHDAPGGRAGVGSGRYAKMSLT
jgi:hypothetical protein